MKSDEHVGYTERRDGMVIMVYLPEVGAPRVGENCQRSGGANDGMGGLSRREPTDGGCARCAAKTPNDGGYARWRRWAARIQRASQRFISDSEVISAGQTYQNKVLGQKESQLVCRG